MNRQEAINKLKSVFVCGHPHSYREIHIDETYCQVSSECTICGSGDTLGYDPDLDDPAYTKTDVLAIPTAPPITSEAAYHQSMIADE